MTHGPSAAVPRRALTLKEARLLRKFAKGLGLNPAASLERVIAEIERLRATRPSAPVATAPLCAAAGVDLDALLRAAVAMRPVQHGIAQLAAVDAVPLPAPLEAVRAAS